MVGEKYWRRLTLLGQSWGSVKMGLEALGECIPDVWCGEQQSDVP
jgi:alpha-1,2-mannosyltransferase